MSEYDLLDEVDRLRATNTSLVDGAKRDSATIAKLREERDKWKRLYEKRTEQLDRLREEVEVYRNADVALRQMNEAIKADSEEAWDENARLRQELHQAKAEWFEEKKRAREVEAELAGHGKGKCVPAGEFERAKEPIFAEGMRAGCEDLMRDAARMDEELIRLRETVDDVRAANRKAMKANSEWRVENARLREDMAVERLELKAELARLRVFESYYEEDQAENARLREALEIWQDWYARLPDLQGRYPIPGSALDKTYDALKETT